MTTSDSGQAPTPSPEHHRLDVFVGTWHSEGETIASTETPAVAISGTDTYEWLPGGFFLVHHVDVRFGDEKVDAIEIIGYDASDRTYPMRSFDHRGNFATMQATVGDDGTWTFTGDGERSTVVLSDDGTAMTADWERSSDGSRWHPWMHMTFTKVT